MPKKAEDAIIYSRHYAGVVREQLDDIEKALPGILDKQMNNLYEAIDDIQDHYFTSEDKDARVGHKSRQDSFGGYKTIIGMTDERIITAATVLTGEQASHARVLRLKSGDQVTLCDGAGTDYLCVISAMLKTTLNWYPSNRPFLKE